MKPFRVPMEFMSRRWQRNVWRWPIATPPTVPPSGPPIFTDEKQDPTPPPIST